LSLVSRLLVRSLIDLKNVRSIAIFIFPDVEELDFVGVYEVLGNTNRMIEEGTLKLDRPLHVDLLATESMVSCRNGLKVIPDKVSSDFTSYDALIIPGGRGIRPLMSICRGSPNLFSMHGISASRSCRHTEGKESINSSLVPDRTQIIR